MNAYHRQGISEEAAIWLMRMEHDPTSDTQAGFDHWIRQGAVHVEEYLLAKAAWTNLQHMDSRLQLRSAHDEASVVRLPREAAVSGERKRQWHRPATLVASVVLLLGAALLTAFWQLADPSYVTRVGRQESVQLDDGSVIHLNTRSHAVVRFSERKREVQLLEGEALFSVAQDAERPFVVVAQDVQIRALGTQFNVYRSEEGATNVAVLEGAVQVVSPGSNLRLSAGEQVQIERGRVVRPDTADVQRAVAWRSRRLMFDDVQGARVDEIAREFNRYNRVPIEVEGEAIRSRRMGGQFDADDPAPFLRFLAKDPDVVVEQDAARIRVYPRVMP